MKVINLTIVGVPEITKALWMFKQSNMKHVHRKLNTDTFNFKIKFGDLFCF